MSPDDAKQQKKTQGSCRINSRKQGFHEGAETPPRGRRTHPEIRKPLDARAFVPSRTTNVTLPPPRRETPPTERGPEFTPPQPGDGRTPPRIPLRRHGEFAIPRRQVPDDRDRRITKLPNQAEIFFPKGHPAREMQRHVFLSIRSKNGLALAPVAGTQPPSPVQVPRHHGPEPKTCPIRVVLSGPTP